jgi:hypothetical protein
MLNRITYTCRADFPKHSLKTGFVVRMKFTLIKINLNWFTTSLCDLIISAWVSTYGHDHVIMHFTSTMHQQWNQYKQLSAALIYLCVLCRFLSTFWATMYKINILCLLGSSHALNLVLNIEEYDHMLGPHLSAGVRVLVRPQPEISRVEDLGLSIRPFAEARIGLQMTLVSYLYGLHLCHQSSLELRMRITRWGKIILWNWLNKSLKSIVKIPKYILKTSPLSNLCGRFYA